MKKIFLSLFLFLILSSNINALEYKCKIEGEKDYITAYNNEIDKNELYTSLNINITNIDNIDSLRLYAKYDNSKYEVEECHFLNYATSGCLLAHNNDNLIFYDYKKSNTYKILDFPFFYINFKSNEKTPKEGKTNIEVYFEDAIDKDGNKIDIIPCTKTFEFKQIVSNANVNIDKVEESSKDIDVLIEGYDFIFDSNTYEYDLKVDKNVTNLPVKVLVSDEYTYTLTGASDLNTYGNRITITIIDSQNKEKVYTINVIKEKEDIKDLDINKNIKNTIKNTNYKKYIPHICIIFISLIVLIIIFRKITARKIDKFLDKM